MGVGWKEDGAMHYRVGEREQQDPEMGTGWVNPVVPEFITSLVITSPPPPSTHTLTNIWHSNQVF